MAFYKKNLAFWSFICASSFANPDAREKYERSLAEANAWISSVMEQEGSCPDGNIAMFCGNKICENFENISLCPQDCRRAPISSYNRQLMCPDVDVVYAPHTLADVQSLITTAYQQKRSVRVVGNKHSVNTQICSEGMIILTHNLSNIIGIEHHGDEEWVTVEPGVTLGELAEWLHDHDRSLGYSVLGFRLATVGGAIATGAHGSSPKHSAVISSVVRSITIINSRGQLQEITEADGDIMRAMRAHLGMLGVVVNIKLAIKPQFKLEVRISDHNARSLLRDNGLFQEIEDCDYALINWFPTKNRFIKTCGQETKRWVDFDAENILLKTGIPPGLIVPFKLALHLGNCYEWVNKSLENIRYSFMAWMPFLQKRLFFFDGFFRIGPSAHVVGYSHRMMSSDFDALDYNFFQNDWELAIPMAYIDDALNYINSYVVEHELHFPLVGIFLRFAPSEDASLLAHSTSIGAFSKNKPVVFVEFPTPTPLGFSLEQKDNIEQPFKDMVETLITTFHARPHWAKNAEWALKKQHDFGAYGENLKHFTDIAHELDPDGMFVNDFVDVLK